MPMICFRAGPYRNWDLRLTGFGRYGSDDGTGRILVQVDPPDQDGRPHSYQQVRLWLAYGNPGYDTALAGINGNGREPMERVLAWVLDHLAELLADPAGVVPEMRDRCKAVVGAGRKAVDDFRAKWGDGPEPMFEAFEALVVTIGREVAEGR